MALFSIALSLFSCIPKGNVNHKIKDNDRASEWINRTTLSYATIEIRGVEKIAFSIVPDDQKNEYIKRLESTQYLELEEDEYFQLASKKLEKKYGLAVRAVYTHANCSDNLRYA